MELNVIDAALATNVKSVVALSTDKLHFPINLTVQQIHR
ncbi:MAG: polysaccharide biosynthesis protein [Cyclobacteriaceae bacterium]|nr:polysaccharide biosynthesis protein [Cyclobacteriaceae bacterium]